MYPTLHSPIKGCMAVWLYFLYTTRTIFFCLADQLDIPPASNLIASPEYTNVAQDYSLPEGSVAPYFHPTATSFCNNWPPSIQIGENYQAGTSTWETNGWFSTPSRGGAGGILSRKSGRPKARWFMVRAALKWVMSRCGRQRLCA